MSTSSTTGKKPSHKGERHKHVPQRMCVSCRDHAAKRQLIRIVRTPEHRVEIDPGGRLNGRGAYLCDDPACWKRAIDSGNLARALNITLDEPARLMLITYLNQMPSVSGSKLETLDLDNRNGKDPING